MKFNKIAVSVLCLFTVAICANAQAVKAPKKDAKTSAKLENVLQKRALQARKAAKVEKCRWCGEPVVEGRRCPADPDVVCTPAPKYVKAKKARKAAKPAKTEYNCPKCGAEYTSDELCRDVYHECADNRPYGEPEAGYYWVESPATEQNDASDGEPHSNLVSVSGLEDYPYGEPEMAPLYELDMAIANRAEVLLQKDRDANNGRAKHDFEYYYNQLAGAEKCRWCGEPVEDSRRCPADTDVNCMGPVSATTSYEANTVSTVKATETHCPKCGAEYDIDEICHGIQHRCEAR